LREREREREKARVRARAREREEEVGEVEEGGEDIDKQSGGEGGGGRREGAGEMRAPPSGGAARGPLPFRFPGTRNKIMPRPPLALPLFFFFSSSSRAKLTALYRYV